jgi:hypothetical protein
LSTRLWHLFQPERPEARWQTDAVAGRSGSPWRRVSLSLAAVLVACQLVFFALLFLAQAVPDDPIEEHLLEAVDDGLYGPTGRPDQMGGTSEAFTECVALGTGLGAPDLSVWERTIRMPRIGSCGAGREQLQALVDDEEVSGTTEYFRYWSGYTVLTRPVLALWGLGPLRMAIGAILAASMVAAAVIVGRRTSMWHVAALGGPLLLSTHLTSMPSTSSNGALAYAVGFLGVATAAWGATRGVRQAVVATAVGAAAFNYVDLLSVPAVPWMLTTAVTGAVVAFRSCDVGRLARTIAAVGLVWPLAFGVTWAARWLLAIVFLGWDHAEPVITDKIGERTSGEASGGTGVLAATRANWRYWTDDVALGRPVLILSALTVAVVVILAVRRGGLRPLAVAGVLAAPALLAPVWYEVLRNHSLVHVEKVYCDLPVAVGVVVAAAVVADRVSRRRGEPAPGASVPDGDCGVLAVARR